jgi:hypothetical protein
LIASAASPPPWPPPLPRYASPYLTASIVSTASTAGNLAGFVAAIAGCVLLCPCSLHRALQNFAVWAAQLLAQFSSAAFAVCVTVA